MKGSILGTRLLESPYCDQQKKGRLEGEKHELKIYLHGGELSLEFSCLRAGIKP